MVCLIKSKYKEELDLYTQLLGSEKRAYAILCCNNGYTLDKTKDGKPSKLYNDLLEYYKGDVTKAVQKKAQLFTSEFTKDYGQWYQDGYEISDEYKDAFDENGEPLLHNTYFGTADNKILLDEQKEFASTEMDLESKLSELRSRYRYIIEQKNTLSKQLRENKIFKGVIHTDDGNIIIQTEHGDDVNILWIDSGDSIFSQVGFSAKFNSKNRILDGSIVLPIEDVLNITNNFTKLENPIKSNYARILKSVLQYFSEKGMNTLYTEWSIVDKKGGNQEMRINTLSKILNIDVTNRFMREVRKDDNKHLVYERERIDVGGLIKLLPVLGNQSQFDDIKKAMQETDKVNISNTLLEENINRQLKSLDKERNDINKKIEDIEQQLRMLKYQQMGSYKYGTQTVRQALINKGLSANEEEQYILEHATRDENGKLLAPNGKPSNLTEKQYVQVRTKAFKEWFGDWENDPKNASKVVDENGEPLVVYHGTQSEFSTVDFNKSDDKISFFATSYDDTADTYGLGKKIKLFFNMRNPYIINGLGQAWDKLLLNDEAYSKEQLKQPYKLKRLTTRDIVKYAKEHGYDGVIFKDIIDNGQYTGMVYENQILQIQQLLENSIENKEYAVSKMYDFFSEISSDVFAILKSENQARFTTDNFTTDNTDKFSRIDRDVTLSDIIAKSDETQDDGLPFNRNANKKDEVIKILNDLGFIHKRNNEYWITKRKFKTDANTTYSYNNIINTVRQALINRGLSPNLVSFQLSDSRNSVKVRINENVTDSISQNTQQITKDEALEIFQKLQSVIPSLKEIKFLSNEETLRMTGGVRANAFVKNGIVYVNKAGFNSKDTVIEECLHSFVNDLSIENKRLFSSLLRRATKDFPKLVASIFENYSDKDGFTQEDRNQELVTQVLSRYMREELKNPSRSLLRNIQNFITWLVDKLQKLFKNPETGKYIIDANFFINGMTFEDIAKILNSNDVQLNVYGNNQIKYNRNSKKRIQKAKNKIKAKLKEGIHIVGTRDSTQKLIDKLSQDIILGTRSKNKSYSSKRNSSVSYGNERQIARNQEAVNFADEQAKTINEAIAERDAEKQLTEQAKLILDFIDHADSDIHEVLQMLQNARDNDFDLLYYNVDQFGNRLYQDTSGNSITAQTAGRNTIASQFSFDDIQYMTTDVLGYYQKLLTDVDNMLLQVPVGRNAVVDEIRDLINSLNLHEQLRTASNIKRQAQEKMLDFYIDQRINQEESSELTDEMKQRLSINIKKWVKSQYDFGDIGGFQKWTQLISDSKSPVVRMMADEIYKMNQEIDNAVVPRGEQLEKALKEAEGEMSILGNHHPINVMTMLMQKDRRGYYNGDFVQPINRRQYFQDLEDFKTALLFGKGGLQDQLKKKIGDDFELELDEYGEPAIPTDSKFDDIYKDYKRKMETFICDHANRRFTKEYYLSRIDTLSPTTIRVLDQFSRKINNLKNSVTVDGKFRPDLLSSKQRAELAQLQKDRQELSNQYDVIGELKDPDSVEGKIAKELSDWSDKIAGKIRYKSDVETFNECLNNLKTQAEKDQFKRMFAYVGLNPHMFEYVAHYDYIGGDQNVVQLLDDIKELRTKLRKLIGINKEQSSYLGYNWDQIFDIRTGKIKNEKLLQQIRSVDKELFDKLQMLRAIRKYDKNDPQSIEEFERNWRLSSGIPYGKLFNFMYYGSVNIDPTQNSTQTVFKPNNNTVYEIVRNNYIQYLESRGMSVSDATAKAEELLNVDKDVPLSLFMIQMPSSNKFKYKDENGIEHKENSFAWVPNQLFSKIDESKSSSEYVNKEFNEYADESVQPKDEYYRDDGYYEMIKHPKLYNLYNELVNSMKDVYKMIPYSGKYDMRLPQMGANTAAILTRNLSKDYGFHFLSNIGSVIDRFANATEVDTDYYVPEYNRRPDGSTIKNIPIRYINRIDDARNISSDLTGGVIGMLKMAINYNVKSKHVSRFESILNSIKENDVGTSNQSEVVEGLIDRLIYEKQNNTSSKYEADLDDTNWFRRKIIGGTRTLLKRLGIARGASTLINLAGRGVSMIVSFLDPFLSTIAEAISGRNYGAKDLMRGLWDTCKEFPQMLASISRRKSYSKTMAIIDALGMEKTAEQRFSNMHHSSVRRFFSDNLMMKGFEVGDYTIKAVNINTVLRNYRMYSDGNGQITFLNRYDYIQRCIQDGMSKQDAVKAYKSAKHARSFITVKNGTLAFRDGMNQEQFLKLGNTAKKIAQNMTLMANHEDRTWLQTNPWTAFITMLRTFMLVGFGERFRSFNDFIVGTDERIDPTTGEIITEISDRNLTSHEIKQQKKKHYYRGGYNFMTGHIENGIYISNLKGLKRLVWDAQKHRPKFNAFFLKYGNMTQEELKQSDISLSEIYSLKRILTELTIVAGCVTLSVLVNRHVQDLDPDDDDNYWWFLLNAVLMRIGIERITMYNPQTVSDLITSITTLTSATNKLFGAFEILGDFLGLTDHDPDETITSNSAYQGYTRSYRATMNMFSIFGTAGYFATMPKSMGGGGAKALDKSTQWYANTAPWRLLYKKPREEQSNTSKQYRDPSLATDDLVGSDLATDDIIE